MNYYKLLDINPDATSMAIKKAYHKLAKKYHPDKSGGDEEMFKKINTAYKVLNNHESRNIYDEYGADAAEDYLNGMFNQMKYHLYPGSNVTHYNIRQDKTIHITAKLESFYTGTSINFEYKQRKACFECSDNCECKGSKIKQVTHNLTIDLPAGAQDGHRVLFPEVADYGINSSPGDLIVYIHQHRHSIFTRMGSDLAMQCSVKLADALCGFIFTIDHIDGTKKNIQETQLKNFIETRVVKGLGMPYPDINILEQCENKQTNRNLIIRYNVRLPQYKIVKDSHSVIKILLDKGREKEPDKKGPFFKTSKYKKNADGHSNVQPGNIRTINECRQM